MTGVVVTNFHQKYDVKYTNDDGYDTQDEAKEKEAACEYRMIIRKREI